MQSEVLSYLMGHEGEHTPKEISDSIGSHVATVRYALRGLERKGDVTRRWQKRPKLSPACYWKIAEPESLKESP